MSTIEITSAAIAFLGVFLTARGSIFGWPLGIIGASLYTYIFAFSSLYAESVLQGIYIFMGIYGWLNWLKLGSSPKERPVIRIDKRTRNVSFGFWLVFSVVIGYLLSNYSSGEAPYIDAALGVGGLVTTYLMARKFLENWIVWIVIDISSAALFYTRELYATSVLYIAFTIIAAQGYYLWKKDLKTIQ